MKKSIYRNIVLIIGILIAIEIVVKLGLHRGLIPLICEVIIIAILCYFIHKLNPANVDQAINRVSSNNLTNDDWQKQHDQWWQAHQKEISRPQKSTNNSEVRNRKAKINQLEINKKYLLGQVHSINHQIKRLKTNPVKSQPLNQNH